MSEQYQALYRKYRPQTFDDVRGRDAIVRTLKNQIKAGRIGHSYLFCGTRGTGKTSIAKIFARAANCETPRDGNPCGACPSCLAISQGANMNVVEMDAASNNGVDDIRTIIDEVSYSPTQGKYRIYIIDEVHMLSTAAFNALLKTLEEPPAYAIFILATTEPNKLPLTILSRCQRYDFGRLTSETIREQLSYVCEKEGVAAEERALRYIAAAADGSMRDGLSLLDQCNAFNLGEESLTYEKTLEILGAVDREVFHRLFGHIHHGRAAQALSVLEQILFQGRELTQFVTDYVWYLRSLMLLKASEETGEMLDVSAEDQERMLEDARLAEGSEILRAVHVFSALLEQIRYAADRRILTEMAILRLCTASMEEEDKSVEQLEERLRQLEEAVISGASLAVPVQEVTQTRKVQSAGERRPEPEEEEDDAPAPELTAALPEDVKQVVASWTKVLSGMPAGLLKVALQRARLSLGDRGQLLVVFGDRLAASTFLDNEEHRREFGEYLQKATGKEVQVEYRLLDNGKRFKDNYVDLQKVVHMEIETEDDGAL